MEGKSQNRSHAENRIPYAAGVMCDVMVVDSRKRTLTIESRAVGTGKPLESCFLITPTSDVAFCLFQILPQLQSTKPERSLVPSCVGLDLYREHGWQPEAADERLVATETPGGEKVQEEQQKIREDAQSFVKIAEYREKISRAETISQNS